MADAGPKLLRGLLEVFILESLEQSPKHGYALLKEMTETFGQEPNRNRLYPLLGRLVRDGYVREVSESGGNRTLYALTDPGREALKAYRRLPSAFRHALRRIWSVEVHPHGKKAAPVADDDEDADVDDGPDALDGDVDGDEGDDDALGDAPEAPAPLRAEAISAARATTVPVRTRQLLDEEDEEARARNAPTPGDALPYPCPDARVTMQKDPRTGDLSIRLTGCPMGAYDYCPQCPVFSSIAGVRRLLFP